MKSFLQAFVAGFLIAVGTGLMVYGACYYWAGH
jgi:hypothetical protein